MNNNVLPELFMIDSDEDALFISDNYFVLYQDNRPFFYKEIKEKLNTDDLKFFIESHLGIKDIKISHLKNTNLKNKDTKKDYRFIKAVKNFHFLYYILYLFVLVCLFIYFFMNFEKKYNKDNFDNLQTNIEKIKKDKKFTYISKEVFYIYENSKINDVLVTSVLFENSKFLLTLESEKKDGIYKLLSSVENSLIEDMQYNKEEKKYEANISFKISRN